MNTGATQLPGYSVVKSAAEQLAERDNIQTTFEVLDLKSFTTSTIDTSAKKKKPKKVKPQAAEVAEETVDYVKTDAVDPVPVPYVVDRFSVPVTFVTPYTEIEVLASEVFIDDTVFATITDVNDRVKVKPGRGAKMSAIYNGETYKLYASGIYIPVESLGSVLSVFFIVDGEEEE